MTTIDWLRMAYNRAAKARENKVDIKTGMYLNEIHEELYQAEQEALKFMRYAATIPLSSAVPMILDALQEASQ